MLRTFLVLNLFVGTISAFGETLEERVHSLETRLKGIEARLDAVEKAESTEEDGHFECRAQCGYFNGRSYETAFYNHEVTGHGEGAKEAFEDLKDSCERQRKEFIASAPNKDFAEKFYGNKKIVPIYKTADVTRPALTDPTTGKALINELVRSGEKVACDSKTCCQPSKP